MYYRHILFFRKDRNFWRVQKNVRKTGNINVEIFYIVCVNMSGEIILEYWKVGQYGPDINQGHLFYVF